MCEFSIEVVEEISWAQKQEFQQLFDFRYILENKIT